MAFLAIAGCAHRGTLANWHLVKEQSGQVLVPPGARVEARPKIQPKIVVRADVALAGGPCAETPNAQNKGVLEIRSHGKQALVTAYPGALSKQPQGWLAEWAEGLEQSGCIPEGEAAQLAREIADSVPLGLNAATRLLHPNNIQTGAVDLTSSMRLQVISPILKEGTPPEEPLFTSGDDRKITIMVSSKNLIGYETAWYSVHSRSQGSGLIIIPEYAERHIDGSTERRPAPETNYFHFPPEAAFYRLFYKSGETDYTAIVLAARTLAELDNNTKRIAQGSCESIASHLCIAIPRRFAINPFISVTVNGADITAPWGSTVADAIRQSGERRPAALLAHLSVERPWKGRPQRIEFDRKDSAILTMVLTGGEAISWKLDARPVGLTKVGSTKNGSGQL